MRGKNRGNNRAGVVKLGREGAARLCGRLEARMWRAVRLCLMKLPSQRPGEMGPWLRQAHGQPLRPASGQPWRGTARLTHCESACRPCRTRRTQPTVGAASATEREAPHAHALPRRLHGHCRQAGQPSCTDQVFNRKIFQFSQHY